MSPHLWITWIVCSAVELNASRAAGYHERVKNFLAYHIFFLDSLWLKACTQCNAIVLFVTLPETSWVVVDRMQLTHLEYSDIIWALPQVLWFVKSNYCVYHNQRKKTSYRGYQNRSWHILVTMGQLGIFFPPSIILMTSKEQSLLKTALSFRNSTVDG
jgi:predicted membrane channel-forming protein YqfA (hemolysin III family)